MRALGEGNNKEETVPLKWGKKENKKKLKSSR